MMHCTLHPAPCTLHPHPAPAPHTPHPARHQAPSTKQQAPARHLASRRALRHNLAVAQASQLSPELGRSLLQMARALLVATRNWSLYPPEHPTVAASVKRLAEAIHEPSLGAIFTLGTTPDTLVIGGAPADPSPSSIADAA